MPRGDCPRNPLGPRSPRPRSDRAHRTGTRLVQQGHGRPSSRQALALKGVVIVRRFATVDSKAGSASGTRPAAFCCSRWGLRLGSAIRAFAGASFISTTVAAGSHAPCIVGIPRTNRGPGTDGIPTTSMTTSCWREPLFAMGREAGTPGRSGGPPSAPAPRPAGATPHGGEADYHAAGIPSTNVASVRGDGPTARPWCVRARDARGVAATRHCEHEYCRRASRAGVRRIERSLRRNEDREPSIALVVRRVLLGFPHATARCDPDERLEAGPLCGG
jgi:hypothetical protein